MKLDIFSDPVCPWCFLGKANLDRALADHPGHPFQIEWHPFQLNPEMPEGGVDKREYLSRRFGAGQLDAIHQRFRDIAAQAGVEMDPDRPQRIPNTLNAHRLVHWAGLEGRQSEMITALMQGYWVKGLDIGASDVLADLAAEVGLERAAILRLLEGEADRAEVLARESHARERGVNAVPTFVLGNQYVLSGAQPPELWGQVIAELAAAGAAD